MTKPSGTTSAPEKAAGPVQVVEVGTRDGLQNEATILATEDKVRFIELAIAAGVRGWRRSPSSARTPCRRWPTPRR
ncbi:hypothetical protein SHIRM173S_05245 [Streptomyces hirsutus]